MAFVQAGETQLEYFDHGTGDRCFLLIHGWTSSAMIWDQVQRNLADQGVRSIALSLRGAGGSDRSDNAKDYNSRRYGQDMALAMKALDPVTWVPVGHSLGVSNVLYFYRDFGNQFNIPALILMAGGGGSGQPVPDERALAAIRARLPSSPDPSTRPDWEKLHTGLSATARNQLWSDILDNPPIRGLGQAMAGRDDMTSLLENMQIPVLVVSGDHDRVVPLEMTLEMYARLPEKLRHLNVFHGADHYPNAAIPNQLADLFAQFIRAGEK